MKDKIFSLNQYLETEHMKRYFKYITLAFVILYLGIFIFAKKCYIVSDEEGIIDKTSIYKAIIVIVLALVTVMVTLVKNKLSDKWNAVLGYGFFCLSPILCYFALEFFHRETFTIDLSKIYYAYYILSFVIEGLILVTIVVLTNSTKVSIIILALVNGLYGLVNYYIYSFRNVALVASDVFSFKTAANVAQDYKLFLDYNIFFFVIETLLLIVIATKFRSFKAIPIIKLRLASVVAYIGLVALCLNVFIFSEQLSKWHVEIKLYRPHEAYRKYGSVLTMVRTLGYIIIDKPEGYSIKEIQEIANGYETKEESGQTPNIIVIMNESFADLKTINDFPTNEDYMPFIRSLNENTIKGSVYSSVFGGNTANSEFEFLTGNSMGLLPANTVPYQLFIKSKFPSIVYSLESQGYVGNIGMHPYKPNGFNRQTVYPLLGFEQFLTLDYFEGDSKLRGKITDEANFNRIIEKYEESKSQSDKPFFLFNITMQNHGGYTSNDPNFEQKIVIEDEYYYDEKAQNYLSLVKYTDEAIEKLVTYFENVEDPTVIIFFGDHQPGLSQTWYDKVFGKSDTELTTEELMAKYRVPFFAWANYDIPEENVDKISINYLSSYIMDKLGMKLTRYQQYLLEVHEQVPAMNSLGYWGVDGNFYNYNDTQSPYYEILNQYKKIQYNNVNDRNKRVDSMFYMD